MKKLMNHEQKRLREHAALTLSLSGETRLEITKKDVAEFARELMTTIQRKRHIKQWLLALVVDTEGDKS